MAIFKPPITLKTYITGKVSFQICAQDNKICWVIWKNSVKNDLLESRSLFEEKKNHPEHKFSVRYFYHTE